jgi:protein-L-isoaspartate(D-aspartate) O-methyltransferase
VTDYQKMRDHMVNSQVRTADVTDERITRALRKVPRERFVPRAQIARAYTDRPIALTPIVGTEDDGAPSRWMLAPRDFAKLIHAADVEDTDAVLDIGCGRGYSSAVISYLCDTVVGVELAESDVERATETLTDIGVENAAVLQSDFKTGGAPHGPFDVIIAQGAVREVPQSWIDQLVDGGRIAVVIQTGPVGRATVFTKSGGVLGGRVEFDATVPLLPGFEAAPEFVF